jgi:hypothetical protein
MLKDIVNIDIGLSLALWNLLNVGGRQASLGNIVTTSPLWIINKSIILPLHFIHITPFYTSFHSTSSISHHFTGYEPGQGPPLY